MGLLPAYVEDDQEIIEELVEEIPEPKEYEINFKTGQLTGRIVEGIEAIKMWIYLTLHTPRFKHTIYPWSHGNEVQDLIGMPYTLDVKESEAERMTKEALLESPYITAIENFNVDFSGSTISLSFTANTDYGSLEVEDNV